MSLFSKKKKLKKKMRMNALHSGRLGPTKQKITTKKRCVGFHFHFCLLLLLLVVFKIIEGLPEPLCPFIWIRFSKDMFK